MEIYKLDVLCTEYEYEWYYVGPVGLETARETFAQFKENEFVISINLYECYINSYGEITTGNNLEYFKRSNKKRGE